MNIDLKSTQIERARVQLNVTTKKKKKRAGEEKEDIVEDQDKQVGPGTRTSQPR